MQRCTTKNSETKTTQFYIWKTKKNELTMHKSVHIENELTNTAGIVCSVVRIVSVSSWNVKWMDMGCSHGSSRFKIQIHKTHYVASDSKNNVCYCNFILQYALRCTLYERRQNFAFNVYGNYVVSLFFLCWMWTKAYFSCVFAVFCLMQTNLQSKMCLICIAFKSHSMYTLKCVFI